MAWSLVTEAGVECGERLRCGIETRLTFPSYAAKADDGSYLISEELGIEKQVPFRFECRTLRVGPKGSILFDSMVDGGMLDGFGCLLPDGSIAIVRRTIWELWIISPEGQNIGRIDLSSFSKRIPRYATPTERGTLLVVFYTRSREVDIVEMDRQGNLLWYYPTHRDALGIVGSVELTPRDTLLLADPFCHVVKEVTRSGDVVWQHGKSGDPSRTGARLAGPCSARRFDDRHILVTDSRNHRVLVISRQGEACELSRRDSAGDTIWCDPVYATGLKDGHYLVCDTGNARVVELNPQGDVIWQYGQRVNPRRTLSYPRSVEYIDQDRYLIADTAHDRVVELVHGELRPVSCHVEPPLFWPRCVRKLPNAGLLIADSRNGRILEVSESGMVVRQLTEMRLDKSHALLDPHDVRMLPNGNLLVTDSSHDLVVETSWSGQVHRVIGAHTGVPLDDPHSAQYLSDGGLLIADTGHHRLVVVDKRGFVTEEIRYLRHSDGIFKLHLPRYAEIGDHGQMVIADTGNNRILASTPSGDFLWKFDTVPGSAMPLLSQPRWATWINEQEILVCDHFHHRIIHVRRDTCDA